MRKFKKYLYYCIVFQYKKHKITLLIIFTIIDKPSRKFTKTIKYKYVQIRRSSEGESC